MAAEVQAADLLLHGAQAKPPAKLVSQIDHEGIYPLRFARVWHSSNDSQLPRHHLRHIIPVRFHFHSHLQLPLYFTIIKGSKRHSLQGPTDPHNGIQETANTRSKSANRGVQQTPMVGSKRHP